MNRRGIDGRRRQSKVCCGNLVPMNPIISCMHNLVLYSSLDCGTTLHPLRPTGHRVHSHRSKFSIGLDTLTVGL